MGEELKKDRAESKRHMDNLKAELAKDSPDRVRIHEAINKMEAINTLIHLRRIDSLLDLRQLLTHKQREKFKRLGEKREHAMKKEGKKPRR